MAREPVLARMAKALRLVSVEPMLFFCMFGYSARLVTLQDLLMVLSCRSELQYPDSVCYHLDLEENKAQKLLSVKYGNNFYTAFMMMSTLPALVVATYLGPWSDRYSRKYPLVMATSGILLDTAISAVIASTMDSSPYWFLLSAAMSGFSGGFIMTLSATYSYLSDITDERSRPTRYAVLEFFTLLATPVGALVGGQVFKAAGYLAVMIIGPCSFGLAVLWAVFFIKETKQRPEGVTRKQMVRDIFRSDNVRSSFQTCMKPRAGNLRKQIWLLVFVSCSTRFVYLGTMGIVFPFTKAEYGWDVTTYSNASTLFSLLNAVATIALVPLLNKKLMLHEAAMGFIGVVSLMARMVITSVAFEQPYLYYAWFCGSFYSCCCIAVQSRISKLVSKQELGRAFSLLATCESLMPVLGTVIMTQLQNASLGIYNGLPFAVSAVVLVAPAAVFIANRSSGIVAGGWGRAAKCLPRVSHTCLIGFRSGDLAGQSMRVISSFCNSSVICTAR